MAVNKPIGDNAGKAAVASAAKPYEGARRNKAQS
jgi:hypothetical protein